MSNASFTVCFFALIFFFSAVLGYRNGRSLFDNWLQGLKEIFDWVARGYLILGGVIILIARVMVARGATFKMTDVTSALTGEFGTVPFGLAAVLVVTFAVAAAGALLGWGIHTIRSRAEHSGTSGSSVGTAHVPPIAALPAAQTPQAPDFTVRTRDAEPAPAHRGGRVDGPERGGRD